MRKGSLVEQTGDVINSERTTSEQQGASYSHTRNRKYLTTVQVSDDCRHPDPLSPNKLLFLRPNQSLPPGVFDKSNLYNRRWWCQTQNLTDVFWKRWIKEYLPTLQDRQK